MLIFLLGLTLLIFLFILWSKFIFRFFLILISFYCAEFFYMMIGKCLEDLFFGGRVILRLSRLLFHTFIHMLLMYVLPACCIFFFHLRRVLINFIYQNLCINLFFWCAWPFTICCFRNISLWMNLCFIYTILTFLIYIPLLNLCNFLLIR